MKYILVLVMMALATTAYAERGSHQGPKEESQAAKRPIPLEDIKAEYKGKKNTLAALKAAMDNKINIMRSKTSDRVNTLKAAINALKEKSAVNKKESKANKKVASKLEKEVVDTILNNYYAIENLEIAFDESNEKLVKRIAKLKVMGQFKD